MKEGSINSNDGASSISVRKSSKGATTLYNNLIARNNFMGSYFDVDYFEEIFLFPFVGVFI